jgi:hypothetical protein
MGQGAVAVTGREMGKGAGRKPEAPNRPRSNALGVVDREVQLFPGLQAAVAAEYKKAQPDHRGIVVASILSGR